MSAERVARYFEIPFDDVATMCSLVEAVPDHWACVCGEMRAPDSLLDYANASPLAGFLVSDVVTIIPATPSVTTVPDYSALVAHRKAPGLVQFARAGLCEGLPLSQVKMLISDLLRVGYRGRLRFWCGSFLGGKRVQYTNNPAWCDIIFAPSQALSGDPEESVDRARVQLVVFPEFNRDQRVEPIARVCDQLKLVEYTPASLQAA